MGRRPAKGGPREGAVSAGPGARFVCRPDHRSRKVKPFPRKLRGLVSLGLKILWNMGDAGSSGFGAIMRRWRVTRGSGFSVEYGREYDFPEGTQGFLRVSWCPLQEIGSGGSLGN